jgi:hypothetical protein
LGTRLGNWLTITRGNQSINSDCQIAGGPFKSMFDAVAGILENGPYCPKDASRNSWEGMKRDYFDNADNCRKTSVCQTLNRPEACLQEPGRNTAQDVPRHSFSDARRRQKRARFGIFLSKGNAVTWRNSAAHDGNNRGDKTPFIAEHFLRGQARPQTIGPVAALGSLC